MALLRKFEQKLLVKKQGNAHAKRLEDEISFCEDLFSGAMCVLGNVIARKFYRCVGFTCSEKKPKIESRTPRKNVHVISFFQLKI